MKTKLIIWAVLCHMALGVPARNCMKNEDCMTIGVDEHIADFLIPPEDSLVVPADTMDILLNEVTVKARSVWRKDDRRLILPSEDLVKKATDGMDLLKMLHLPRISVNQLTGEVGLASGETVRLCINGVQVTAAEIASVSPDDILRIEYHDSPGIRYGDAGAVIDYITKHRVKGGNVNGDFFNGFGKEGLSAIDAFSIRRNSGNSEWSLGAQYMQVKRNDWIRDYDEIRMFPEGNVYRNEVGSPVTINVKSMDAYLNYSYIRMGKLFFNIRMNYVLDDIPNSEEGDRRNLLFTSDADAPLSVDEHMEERSHSPALDFYFQYTLRNGGKLIFDAVGTYIKTSDMRLYSERRGEEQVSDISSFVRGRKYSLITEGIYEQKIGTHSVTGGFRHMQAYMNNVYSGTVMTGVSLKQSESSVYAEYGRHVGRWGYMANLMGMRLFYSQKSVRAEKNAVQPSVRISFEPDENSYFKYRVDLRTDAPSLSAMNDTEQKIDVGLVRRGNTGLKSFQTLRQTFSAGWDWKYVCVDLTLGYKHEFNPIMETVGYEEGLFVRMYENQRSFRHLSAEATFTVRPWKNYIVLSLTPEFNRYISSGNGYLHTYTMPRMRWDAELSYGKWLLSYNTLVGYANYVYGERLMKEKNMHTVMLGYRLQDWSLQLGLLNPFLKEYWMDSRDWSDLVPSVSRAHSHHPLQFMVKVNFNLNYGKVTQRERKQIHNEDRETGIMQGTKK